MGMSDRIEAFILELMRQEQQDWITIQRNEMAQLFEKRAAVACKVAEYKKQHNMEIFQAG